MYCVRPLLKRHSEEAVPEHILGAGQSSPAPLGCWWGCCKPAPITGMPPHTTDVRQPRSRLDRFPGVGVRLKNAVTHCCTSQRWLGKHNADAAVLAVLWGPGPQLRKSAFLHRGADLNDSRWGAVFAGWKQSAWMYVYLAFGMCMHVYISMYIHVKAHVKAENSPKIQA